MSPGDSGSSTLRLLGIGCLVVLIVAAVGTIAVAVFVVRGWRTIPTIDPQIVEAGSAWAPPPEVAAWPDDAGVIVDVSGTSVTAMHAPPAGVYLVNPDDGTYARWSGPTAACFGASQCGSWAAAHEGLYTVERSGRILGVDMHGAVAPVDLDALQAPTADANVPITSSWDSHTIAYSTFGDGRQGTIVLDLAHGKVLQPRLERIAPSRWMALSPNGSKLAYVTGGGVSFMAVANGKVTPIPAGAVVPWRGAVRTFAWSPDGGHLLAVTEAVPPQNARELWVIDATTHAPRRIATPAPRQDPEGDVAQRVVSASFAPDGKRVLVLSDVDAMCVHPRTPTPCLCDAALYVVATDGSGWRRVGPTFQACGDVLWER